MTLALLKNVACVDAYYCYQYNLPQKFHDVDYCQTRTQSTFNG